MRVMVWFRGGSYVLAGGSSQFEQKISMREGHDIGISTWLPSFGESCSYLNHCSMPLCGDECTDNVGRGKELNIKKYTTVYLIIV